MTPGKIDDVGWHYESARGTFLLFGKWNAAAAHIALYLRWVVENGFEDSDLRNDPVISAKVRKAKSGKISFSQLLSFLDGKLIDFMMIPEIQDFSEHYYDRYVTFLASEFPDMILGTPESGYDYNRIKKKLDEALSQWRAEKGKS